MHNTVAYHPLPDARPHSWSPIGSPSPLPSQAMYWAWHSRVWVSLWPVQVIVHLICLTASFKIFFSSSLAEQETQKSPWFRINATHQQPKHQCLTNIIPILNPKLSTVPGTENKIIPSETSTACERNIERSQRTKPTALKSHLPGLLLLVGNPSTD